MDTLVFILGVVTLVVALLCKAADRDAWNRPHDE